MCQSFSFVHIYQFFAGKIVDGYKICIVNKAPKFFLQLESSFGDIEICLADDYLIKEYGVCM